MITATPDKQSSRYMIHDKTVFLINAKSDSNLKKKKFMTKRKLFMIIYIVEMFECTLKRMY